MQSNKERKENAQLFFSSHPWKPNKQSMKLETPTAFGYTTDNSSQFPQRNAKLKIQKSCDRANK